MSLKQKVKLNTHGFIASKWECTSAYVVTAVSINARFLNAEEL